MEKGRSLFEKQGLQKTSVAELAKTAGISQGAFYLFFPSKEALFFAIVLEREQRIKQEIFAELQDGPMTADRFAHAL